MANSHLPIIGPYRLGQDYATVEESLTEVAPAGYAVIGTLAFDDEKVYDGERLSWLGWTWGTILGVTGGKIYKLGLTAPSDGGGLTALYERVRTDLASRFGPPSESKKDGAHLIWDEPWGNVVLSYLTAGTNEGINVWYTWAEPFGSMPPHRALGKALRYSLGRLTLSRRFREDVLANWSHEEKSRWCWLRAIEWSEWPLFITQPVIPVLLAFVPWWQPIVGVLVLSWLWPLAKTRFISVTGLRVGVYLVLLKWPVSIGMAIYLAISGRYCTAALAGLWPLAAAILQLLTPPSEVPRIQTALVARLMQGTLKPAPD